MIDLNSDGFINGLQNAKSIISKLEKSIHKSSKYERRLSQCKSNHTHSHSFIEWDNEFREDTNKWKAKGETARNDVTESWSTMSIVCLQYQYEELTKRYESLLEAFNERCNAVNSRDNAINDLKQRLNACYKEMTEVHQTLITVCNKYLTLKHRKNIQLSSLNKKIHKMKTMIKDILKSAEQARNHFDDHLARCLSNEKDAVAATLLTEITICNRLFVENLKLKAHIHDLEAEVTNELKGNQPTIFD